MHTIQIYEGSSVVVVGLGVVVVVVVGLGGLQKKYGSK